ncbi:MAG: ABC transporter permease [Anaerolineales bacterium]|nr:ABC transporter permease [Anaerolineales bacterium]MCL4257435.1 ABC transporter permease [Anaerolineales bacterium]QYK51918.1 MAG: ABC transporter permease [Anaerolineales bacterium]
MNYLNSFVVALESLAANKLRSALTVLGIVIGVAAVIAMLAVGRGAQSTITGTIEGIGTNLLFVMSGGNSDVTNPKPLTLADAQAMQDSFQAPSVIGVAPMMQGSATVTAQGESTSTTLEAVTPDYGPVRNIELAEGEFINEAHILSRSAVVILGPDVAEEVFGRTDGVVGETVRIEGQPFRVIGLLVSKGGSGFTNEDNRVLVPLTTAQARLLRRSTPNRVDMIIVQAANSDAVPQASEEIAAILRARHRTGIGADDFTVFNQQDFLDTAAAVTGVLTIFLGGVAAISLLVGGIGIMNIMLVSVIERTREIGLRKALGARKRDIMIQFLAESSMLSLLGGVLGIIFGWLISAAVGAVAAASNADITPVIGLDSVLLATLFSMAVGLFFGLYPANRAASLQPVEALRYE